MPTNPNIPAAPVTEEPSEYESLTCIMGGCTEALHLVWKLSAPLLRAELAPDADPYQPADAWAGDWRIECEEGHVILVPGPAGSKDAAEEAACEANLCDHDHSDELRTWRRSDVDRLAALVAPDPPDRQ